MPEKVPAVGSGIWSDLFCIGEGASVKQVVSSMLSVPDFVQQACLFFGWRYVGKGHVMGVQYLD